MRKKYIPFYTVTATAKTPDEIKVIRMIRGATKCHDTGFYLIRAPFRTISDARVFRMTYAELYYIDSQKKIDNATDECMYANKMTLGPLSLSINKEKQYITR